MKYRIHRVKLSEGNEEADLERFLNGLKGEVISVVPVIKRMSLFQIYGATQRVDFHMIVERIPSP